MKLKRRGCEGFLIMRSEVMRDACPSAVHYEVRIIAEEKSSVHGRSQCSLNLMQKRNRTVIVPLFAANSHKWAKNDSGIYD